MKLVPMETENGFQYLWPQQEEDEKRETNLDRIAYASMRDFYNKPGQHGLVLGAQYGCLPLETRILWTDIAKHKLVPVQLKKILNHHGFVRAYDWRERKTKIVPAQVKPSGRKKVSKITLEDGKTVSASADHIFFVRENGEVREKRVSQLKIRDVMIEMLKAKRIVSIEDVGEKETADLVVPFYNNFFLPNGILSHNSGKTTLLFWLLGYHFIENHETCILRMRKSTFEFLSLLEKVPVRLFVPEGCIFRYEHPGLEIREYNPNRFMDIFDNLAQDKINVISHDQYAGDYKSKFQWWGQFFERLLEWKATHMNRKMGVYIDELGDLVPNKGESLCPEHTYYGNQIHDSIDAYRRSNIRMVCVTHSLVDLRKTFRNQFHYWFIKRSNREVVPGRFQRYGAGIIEKLENWEVLIKDVKGHFNRRPSPVWVFPKNRSVFTKSSPRMMLSQSEQRYAWRLALANAFLKQKGFTYYDRMEALGYRSKGSVVTLEQSFPLGECPYPIRFLNGEKRQDAS